MCAIFGLLDYMGKLTSSQRRQIVRELGKAAEVRGTDATGIAFFHEGRLHIQKAPRPARRMKYRIPEEARYIMGHTRMTTQGSARRNQNNHPFAGKAGDSRFALAHNGVIFNDLELRRSNKLPTTAIETDSYIAVQLIERQKEVSPHSLRRMAEVLEGHFTFTVLDQEDTMYFIRGDNPLTIWWCPDMGVYLYASTKEILERAAKALGIRWWRKEVIEPDQGTILAIDREGQRSVSRFDDSNLIASWRWYSPLWKPINHQEDEYLSMVMDMGEQLGISRQELGLLSRAGYSAWDMEDLLYDDALRACCLADARRSWRRGEGEASAVDAWGSPSPCPEEAAILGDDSELAEKTLRKGGGALYSGRRQLYPWRCRARVQQRAREGYSARDISLDV